jgi:hypothetical protein
MTRAFGLTFDYRCPFACNVHLHVVAGLEAGADWDVRWLPFSLNQPHVAEGEPSVFDDERHRSDLLAIAYALVVRDRWPERFPAFHAEVFRARHEGGLELRDPSALDEIALRFGLSVDEIADALGSQEPYETFRREHFDAADRLGVFGVPTFVFPDDAVFVRLMTRPGRDDDPKASRAAIERILDLIEEQPELNELKHTQIAR